MAFIVTVFLVLLIAMIIFFAILSPKRNNYNSSPIYSESFIDSESSIDSSSPKLTASVSRAFHDDVQRYCQGHHMTISDLIRKSVKQYMEENS